jgi:hypothetical protein
MEVGQGPNWGCSANGNKNGVAVTLPTNIQDTFGSNLKQNICSPHRSILLVSVVPLDKNQDTSSITRRQLPSKSFQIHHSSVTLSFDTTLSNYLQDRKIKIKPVKAGFRKLTYLLTYLLTYFIRFSYTFMVSRLFFILIILQKLGLLGWVIRSSQGLYLHTGQHKHIPNIHTLCGIRTHDPGSRASEDNECRRLLGYRDRRF